MTGISNSESSSEDSGDLNALHFPPDNGIFQESDNDDGRNSLPEIATPYLPPYPNPSRYPSAFQNNSLNSTFEVLFHFTPTLTNLMILACLVTCTLWVIIMNTMIIGALLKAHARDKEHVLTDIYLVNLLICDVGLGLFVFPFMSIVILIGYFPLSATWCNIWVYFDYYLIISSSYGFAALMVSYLLMLRWPEYYPESRRLHIVFTIFIWVLANAPWTAPFINDRISTLYPEGVCGFSIEKNRYFTFYIGFTGFYIPLGITLIAGIFSVKYLKQSARAPFLKLLLQNESCHVHPFVPTSPSSEFSEFNDLYQVRREIGGGNYGHQKNAKPQPGLSPSEIPSESTDGSSSPKEKKRRLSRLSIRTLQRNKALQDSVRRHFPLVATSLIFFVLSRSLFYTYFGIGSVVPKLFPPDLSHSVYWIMHSYAVAAPIVHLCLDRELRLSVIRFVNEGTFELPPLSGGLPGNDIMHKKTLNHAITKVSVIEPSSDGQHRQHYNGKSRTAH